MPVNIEAIAEERSAYPVLGNRGKVVILLQSLEREGDEEGYNYILEMLEDPTLGDRFIGDCLTRHVDDGVQYTAKTVNTWRRNNGVKLA